jgi:hypothetical protein
MPANSGTGKILSFTSEQNCFQSPAGDWQDDDGHFGLHPVMLQALQAASCPAKPC